MRIKSHNYDAIYVCPDSMPPPSLSLFHSFLSSPRYVSSSLSFSHFVRHITPSTSTLTPPSPYLSHTFLFSPPSLPLLINFFLYHLSPLHPLPITHPTPLSPIFVLSFFRVLPASCIYTHSRNNKLNIRAFMVLFDGEYHKYRFVWQCMVFNTLNVTTKSSPEAPVDIMD